MTGVAAQLCGDRKVVESLGYRVDEKGVVYDGEKKISRLGARKAVLNDLSPAATFIAYNYNTPVNARAFEREAKRILAEVEAECGWMYETRHVPPSPQGRGNEGEGVKGRINYTIWSDVFRCPHCGQEMVFWDVAVDQKAGGVKDTWVCQNCGTLLAKNPKKESGAQRVERVMDTVIDRALGRTIQQARQVPVLINYTVGKEHKEKVPDKDDLALIQKIENGEISYHFPIEKIPIGDKTTEPIRVGITNVHHFYALRSLWVLAVIYFKTNDNPLFLGALISVLQGLSKLQRFRPNSTFPNMILSGTLYVGSMIREWNVINWFDGKIRGLIRSLPNRKAIKKGSSIIETQSSTKFDCTIESRVDYLFIDPPFGGNLMYSELNFLWEAWLRVYTNNQNEAIMNKEQRKGLNEYQSLMEACFTEFYRLLKPGRWMTVEFHNSQNSVWNAIQEGLMAAGFIVADVRTLDKQQNTFNQATASVAVKQDLIISAYRPQADFERKFALEGGSAAGAWDFVRQHLEQLPMPNLDSANGVEMIEVQRERMPFLLYDRMVAYHFLRGLSIPLSSAEFYQGLSERWLVRDGMVFTSAQTSIYDRMSMKAGHKPQLSIFVTDETSAIQWLATELNAESGHGPQTYAEISPRFMQQLFQEKHEKLPELKQILEDNFLPDKEMRWFVPDAENQEHLKKQREVSLLREFKGYLGGKGRLELFRIEAVRSGFSKAWGEHDYDTIIRVAERLPEQVLLDEPQLKLYYDNALNRAPKTPKQERLI